MRIAFCHHLSLKYHGGGEKWLAQLANELVVRGHEVEIRALPFVLSDGKKTLPHLDDAITYIEKYFHTVDADITYVTYHPFNWLSFKTTHPKIGGIHSHCYWQPIDKRYGLLPNLANLANAVVSKWELKRFDAIHTVTNLYPINHEKVFFVPNFVDSEFYHPMAPKNKEFTVGFASRKVWQKGYDIFLKLQETLKDVNFVATMNLPEKEMPTFYSKNHLTLVPSRVDTFGISVVESNMCGTPVLSSGLETHKKLSLPLIYAKEIEDYVAQIKSLKESFENGDHKNISGDCRRDSLKFDKKIIVDEIERMFYSVMEDNH